MILDLSIGMTAVFLSSVVCGLKKWICLVLLTLLGLCGSGSIERRIPCFETGESDVAGHVQEILRVSEDRQAGIRISPSTIWHVRIGQGKRMITKMLWKIFL